MGNYEALGRGCVQYMSAGTGVVHAEMNDGDKTCRFLQASWVQGAGAAWLVQAGAGRGRAYAE